MPSKSIFIIVSYTVLKLARFSETHCICNCKSNVYRKFEA